MAFVCCQDQFTHKILAMLIVLLEVDDERDDEDPRGLKSVLEFSQCVCVELICVWHVVGLHIMREHPNYWELWRIVIEIQKVDHVRGLWFFVKLMKQSTGSWSVLFSCFYVLSIWWMVSWTLVCVIYLDLRVYVTKCNLGLGFLWKFNVVMGLCGLKKLGG
jgi:hypothetical protein